MQEHIFRLGCIPEEEAYPIAILLQEIAVSFHEYNNSKLLLAQVYALQENFRESSLPKEHDEFGARAMLFTLLGDIEYFLILKKQFFKKPYRGAKKAFLVRETINIPDN